LFIITLIWFAFVTERQATQGANEELLRSVPSGSQGAKTGLGSKCLCMPILSIMINHMPCLFYLFYFILFLSVALMKRLSTHKAAKLPHPHPLLFQHLIMFDSAHRLKKYKYLYGN
jgi:hypothetical protein